MLPQKRVLTVCLGIMLLALLTVRGQTGGTYHSAVVKPEAVPLSPGGPARIPGRHFSPLGLSLMPPAQWPPESWDVTGLRLNILAGYHNNVDILDIGVIANMVKGEMNGVQICGILNHNSAAANTTGLQVACVNLAGGMAGLQVGLYNAADEAFGLQIGVVNYSVNLAGMQIGLINIISGSTVPVMPILNFGF